MHKSRLIAFDFDMTLVDTSESLAATLLQTLPTRYHKSLIENIHNLNGLKLKEILRFYFNDDEMEQMISTFNENYLKFGVPAAKIMPGAQEAIDVLHKNNFKVVIISAKNLVNLRKLVDHFELNVDGIFGDSHGTEKTNKLRENKARLYIGDLESDVYSAHQAGVPCIRISSGISRNMTQAEWFLTSLDLFPEWFESYISESL